MGADNQTIGSDWRGWGMRMGMVSMMAATGMVLAGHAAQATPAVTQSPGTEANGGGEGLPLGLMRVPDGNSGATCIGAQLGAQLDGIGAGAGLGTGIGEFIPSDRALKDDITPVDWSR